MIDPAEWPYTAGTCRAIGWAFRGLPGVDIEVMRAAAELNMQPLALADAVLEGMRVVLGSKEFAARQSMLHRATIRVL